MRTTIDLPDDLIKEAKAVYKTKTKTALIIHALENLIRDKKIEELRSLRGKIDLDINLKTLRRDRKLKHG